MCCCKSQQINGQAKYSNIYYQSDDKNGPSILGIHLWGSGVVSHEFSLAQGSHYQLTINGIEDGLPYQIFSWWPYDLASSRDKDLNCGFGITMILSGVKNYVSSNPIKNKVLLYLNLHISVKDKPTYKKKTLRENLVEHLILT